MYENDKRTVLTLDAGGTNTGHRTKRIKRYIE